MASLEIFWGGSSRCEPLDQPYGKGTVGHYSCGADLDLFPGTLDIDVERVLDALIVQLGVLFAPAVEAL